MTAEQPDTILATNHKLFSTEPLKPVDCGYTELIWH
jgi:hypothetical protein